MVVTSNLRPRNVGKEIQAGGTVPSRRKDNLAIGYFYPSTLNVRNKITFDIRAEGKKYKGYPAEFEQYMTEALDMVSALAPRAKRTRETLSTPAP